ncbi:MAG: aldo/keto reductase [Chloroflexi bacterium]|nr:aldo/keto reductase [Chloroflexota bacterium]
MELRRIPNTDIEVSTICLGTMTFGTPVGEYDAVRLVHWAIDNGINFFDTADIYEGYARSMGSAGGVAETILGKALKGRRERVYVTTKVGNPVGGEGYKGTGLGREHVIHQIDDSLKRLQTDYVDFYELHKSDADTPLTETVSIVVKLIEQGKVLHWGFSNFEARHIHDMVTICDVNDWPRPVVAQPSLNWLDRAAESEYLPACVEYDIAVTPYTVLSGGVLTGKYHPGEDAPPDSRAGENPAWKKVPDQATFERLMKFESEAAKLGLEPVQYAVKWVLDRPNVVSAIVGAKRIEQLEPLVGMFK